MASDCVFCQILTESLPHHLVDEDDLWIAILDTAPAMPGHTLLIPRTHVEHLWDVDRDVAGGLGAGLQRVANRLETRLRPAGLTVFQANRVAGWQSVPHVHFHLIPRAVNDPLVPSWTDAVTTDADELAALASRLSD